jgi:hypothetical protein
VGHSSIPHLGFPTTVVLIELGEKEVFTFKKKSFFEDWVNYIVTRGFRTG